MKACRRRGRFKRREPECRVRLRIAQSSPGSSGSVTAPRLLWTRRSRSIRTSARPFAGRRSSRRSAQGCDDNFVMDLPSLRRPRIECCDRRAGRSDRDPSPSLHQSQRAADRALVEADDVTNGAMRDARLDCEQRHHPPLGDIDTEAPLVKRRGAARQLVSDERERRPARSARDRASAGLDTLTGTAFRREPVDPFLLFSHHPQRAIEK